MRQAIRATLVCWAFFAALSGCSSSDPSDPASPLILETGSADGHADVFGAKAAGQARAARLNDPASIPGPAHGRQQFAEGDYVLANDKIAVVVEGVGLSDGYARFGGEILAIDKVGDDGRPLGLSMYNETLWALSSQMVKPDSVTVLRDGSDGGDAIVRALGPLTPIPFIDGPLSAIFPAKFDMVVAYDFVLAPGSEAVVLRLVIPNATSEAINFGVDRPGSDELFGFFHYSRSHMVTAEAGFAEPETYSEWVGFDGGPWGFAFRPLDGAIEYGLEQSGFALFYGPGFVAEPNTITTSDRMQVIAGGPNYDGLRDAVNRVSHRPPWREVKGQVLDATGAPVEGAWVHEVAGEGDYLSRTLSGPDGSFSIHAPDRSVALFPQKKGYPQSPGFVLERSATTLDLPLGATGILHVTAKDAAAGEALPVRVQVIPSNPPKGTPERFGVLDEVNGRLYQEFAVSGEATLVVPPGEHRVIVSRGYEWEMLDTTVQVAAGETTELPATLTHSVDTTGYMCADFHIHSFYSADSNDPVEHKVRGAIADGLDIPVSSEHEWVAEFQPVIEKLGLTKWAFGVSSEELTTFTWGHFGVVPLYPKHDHVNNGAIDWVGLLPKDVFAAVDAVPEKPALIVNHPSGGGFGAYFDAALFDRKTGHGSDEMWSDNFDAVEVFNDSDFDANRDGSVADWFALLNVGKLMGAVGSSDSHHLRTSPVGYPRTCMFFGHDNPNDLTPEAVRDGILAGNSTISGGAFMTVEGPAGEMPGETVVGASNGVTFTVRVSTPSFIQVDTLEIIVDGVTVDTVALLPIGDGPAHNFANQVTVLPTQGKDRSWVVFHAKGETDLSPLHPGRRPFAVSNPVFLTQ